MSDNTADAYRPSGLMCLNCKHLTNADCAELPFSSMRTIKTDKDGTKVVQCRRYEKAPKHFVEEHFMKICSQQK